MTEVAALTLRNPENVSIARMLQLIAAPFGAILALTVLLSGEPALAAMVAVATFIVWTIADRVYRQPCVIADADGITVVNPRAETHLAWRDVSSFAGGRYLTITTTSGDEVRAWGVQNANVDRIRRRDGFADRAAAQLEAIRRVSGA